MIKERAARLRAKGQERLQSYMASLEGQAVELLMERDQMGRAENFMEVMLEGPYQPGAIIRAKVQRGADGQLKGEVLA